MTKSNKQQKGCVGFLYKGIFAQGKFRAAYSEDKEPTDLYDELVKVYGTGVIFKYVLCENPEEVFKKFKADNKHTQINDDLYAGHIEPTEQSLKKVSGINCAHLWPKRSNKKEEDTEEDDKNKAKKPSSEDKSGNKKKTQQADENEDEEITKSSSKKPESTNKKKAQQADEDEEEVVKKSSSKKPEAKKAETVQPKKR